MTEAEWLACVDPELMLAFLHGTGRRAKFEAFSQTCFILHRIPLDWRVEEASPVVKVQTLRCLYGNPFRPITIDPSWLTTTVLSLAQGMYDSRDFSAMPILADALADEGCIDEAILAHCREVGPHCRGCHVVDEILRKF